MNNPIRHWSYNLPTQPGIYLMCYGDVEAHDSLRYVRFIECGGELKTEDGLCPADYSDGCKWARLLVSPSEIEEHSNA